MMQVYIAGVNHFDPLCRARLQDWLQSLLDVHPTRPSFVAVEYDEDIFNKIKLQRPKLRSLAASLWLQSTPEFLDALELSLAFDADTHKSLIPEIETVWLDHGRITNDIENYSSRRLEIYKMYIPENNNVFDTVLLERMSLTAWAQSDALSDSATNRDAKFAEIIFKYHKPEESGWAIVIVGQKHASRDDGWIARRLEEAGFNCEIYELRPYTKPPS